MKGLEPLTRVSESSGTGDVAGPASAVDNRIAVFDGTTGKLIKDGGSTIADIVAGSGGLVTSVFGRTGHIVAEPNDYTFAQINRTTSSLADLTTRSAGDLSSGTLLAARMPALTGDITSTVGTVSTTIANNAVSLAKMADIATASFLGRNTASTGDPEVLSIATAKTMLGLTGSNTGDVTLSGENYISLAGQALTANQINLSGTHVTSTLPVTKGGSGTATQFTAGSVVFAGASGVYAQDNASLFWDDTNNRLGIGTASPTQKLEVTGNVFINSATANLFLKDISTGFQSASTTVITPQNNNAIRSTNFTSGLVGWNISALGNAEFNNVDIRGAIHAGLIVFNALQATAGTLGVFKSAAKLRSDVVIPAAPTYGTTTVDIDVVDPDGLSHAASQMFVGNDILRIKDGLVGDTWFKVSAVADQGTHWRYGAIIMAGTNNVTYRAGLGVADYGLTGQGFIIHTADQTNSPYLQMATHASGFSSLNSSGTLTVTPRLRLGNLNGSYGYASDVFGFGTGQYGTAGQSWVTVDPTNGVRIGNNTTTRIQLLADGSGFLATNNISWTTAGVASISGWTINTATMTNGGVTIAAGSDPVFVNGTAAAFFGKFASDNTSGLYLKGTAGTGANVGLATNPAVGSGQRPYLFLHDSTRYRVVIGELNTTAWDGVATNSMGMKIWSSAGTKLVEFSDVQNIISGWTISATSLSSGSGSTTVAMDSGGTNPAFYAGSSTPGSAPFRVTNAGALVASNATVTGAITATSGSLSGLSISGTLTMSGASAAIAIGITPPTSASAGTGIWLDRTGLYGLAAGVVQTKIDAVTGALIAGGGEVTVNASGVNFNNGEAAANRIKWLESTRTVGETWTGRAVGTGIFHNLMAHSRGTGTTGNDEISAMTITADNGNTNGGGTMNIDIIVHGPAHATRPNQQVMYATWAEGIGSPALKGGLIVGPGLGFTAGLVASTALEVRSTTGAFLLGRMTTTQRDALTATDGHFLYNTTTGKFQGRAAGAWVDLH